MCDLTRGRIVDCKDAVGGLKAVYFTDKYYANIRGEATIANDEMTAAGFATWEDNAGTAPGAVVVYKYDLRPDLSSFTPTAQVSKENGTVMYEQVLSLVLQKQTKEDSLQFRLMAQGRSQIFVLDSNDNLWLMGIDEGCDVTSYDAPSGAARTDLTGYNITLTGMEKEEKIWVEATAGKGTAKYPFDNLTDIADLTITAGS